MSVRLLAHPAFLALLVVGAVPVAPAAAQDSGSPRMPRAVQEPPAELTPELRRRVGSAGRIRVVLGSGETLEGRSVGWAGEWLLLRNGRAVRLDRIARIEALRPRTEEGMKWGVWAGAIAGAGGTVLSGVLSGRSGGAQAALGFAGLAGGAAAGGIVGAAVGSRRHVARPLYAASVGDEGRGGVLMREYRRGPSPGRIRTRLAVTPYVAFATFGARTERVGVSGDPVRVGLSTGREAGVQIQYALGPRAVVRAGAGAIRAQTEIRQGTGSALLPGARWIGRGELGVELRMRSNVPGYFIVAADAVYDPEGYVLGAVPTADDPVGTTNPGPVGVDAGLLPRLGAGLGFDFFGDGDRRVRLEWIYRLGLYHHPGAEDRGYDPERVTRDATLSVGFHIPLARPGSGG